jgi:hypothetical protein
VEPSPILQEKRNPQMEKGEKDFFIITSSRRQIDRSNQRKVSTGTSIGSNGTKYVMNSE